MIETSDSAIVLFTLQSALISTAIVVPIGLAISWALARLEWPGKSIVETMVALPLVMPPVATGLILLKLFGRRGPFDGFFDIVFTWRAVVIAMIVMSMPLFVRSARVALEEVNVRYEHVARTLGASEPRVFFAITLPLALRGIVAGTVLALVRAIGEFGATIVVAGNIPGRTTTISLAIFNRIELGKDAEAYRLLVVSVIIAFAALWINEAVVRRRPHARA
ncbi:MAG TPA: molybdate ABC transporter permease subunit [Thermoanaerobaculia bacterium]|nr:molybdate ABC transporter permease subunit [Thermoanaerobaculia bacterium]